MITCAWSKTLPVQNPWARELCGCFYKRGDHSVCFYAYKNQVHMLFDNETESHAICCMEKGQITQPSSWHIYGGSDSELLLLNETLGIDLRSLIPSANLSADASAYYRAKQKEKRRDGILMNDDDYCIKARGQSSYVCESNGQRSWTFTGQAYLYTPIYRYADNICFGTAGKGGWVYIISLKTGEVITKIKTGGTVSIVQIGGLCFFLANLPKATLLCVDLLTGEILQEVSVRGISEYSTLYLLDKKLHTITFEYRNRILVNAIWHCFSLDTER